MWLTCLFDARILILFTSDKPLQEAQSDSNDRWVNRRFGSKEKEGLGSRLHWHQSQMNMALAMYSKAEINPTLKISNNSLIEVRNHLHLLAQVFHNFDSRGYFSGTPTLQLECLNRAAEFALQTKKIELRFMGLVKRLKAAYDVCVGSEEITQDERERIHFYLAVRSIVYKLTKGGCAGYRADEPESA